MDQVYRSKVDWWVWLAFIFGIIAILGGSVAVLASPPAEGFPAIWIAIAMLLMAAFMGWIGFSVYYAITSTDLIVRAACFRWQIPLGEIVEVFPTHNPLSSPALSLDQLRVRYKRPSGKTWWVMISPNDKERFLDSLAKAAGLDREDNRLRRRE